MEVGVELRKAMQHHLESLLELFGGNDNMRATVKKIADMVDGGSEQAVQRVSQFLSSAKAVHDGLRGVARAPEPGSGFTKEDDGIFYSRWKTRRIVMADASADPDVVQRVVEGIIQTDYDGDGAAYAAAVAEYKAGLSVTDDVSERAIAPVLSNRRGVVTDSGKPASPGYNPGPGYEGLPAGSSAVAPGYQPSVKKTYRDERQEQILKAAMEGWSWLDALLYKAETEGGMLMKDVLAREITTRLRKAADTRTPALEDPESRAIYELHRALVGHGSEMTVFEMRQVLKGGSGGILERVEAMSKSDRQKWLAEHPEEYMDYREEHVRRASMGGDVG